MGNRVVLWLSVARSLALIVVGIFLLVYETAIDDDPNHYIVGAGLIALGVTPAVSVLRNGNGGTK